MEIRRVNSDYQFSVFNIFREILLILLQCIVGYYAVTFSRFYYYKFTKKTKNICRSKLLCEIFFSFITILYATFLIYLLHITSFKKLRDYIYNIWKNLFSTDSNLRDLDSFVTFYCMDNFYNKKAENSKEKFTYTTEYEKSLFITRTAFESSVISLCRGFEFIDSQKIELCIILGIFISQFLKNYEVFNSHNEDGESNSFIINFYKVLDEVSLYALKLFYIVNFIYFISVYIETYMNYNKIYKLHYLQNTNKSIENQHIKLQTNKQEKIKLPEPTEKENSIWVDMLIEFIQVIIEAL
jgi:hypothetical protein